MLDNFLIALNRQADEERKLLDSLDGEHFASFDSFRTKKVAPCSKDTRVGVLDDIQGWATKDGDQGHIFWLNGFGPSSHAGRDKTNPSVLAG